MYTMVYKCSPQKISIAIYHWPRGAAFNADEAESNQLEEMRRTRRITKLVPTQFFFVISASDSNGKGRT